MRKNDYGKLWFFDKCNAYQAKKRRFKESVENAKKENKNEPATKGKA